MSLRLFIALHLEDAIRFQLSRLQEALRVADVSDGVRWVNPDATHLTLRFLGDTPEGAVSRLVAALGAELEDRRGIELGLAGIGGFPSLERPRVLWVGLVGDLDALHALHQRVEAVVVASGWPAENRPFQPHLTLGRARHPERPLAAALVAAIASARIETVSKAHQGVALVRSHLGPAGSRYEDVAGWNLGA